MKMLLQWFASACAALMACSALSASAADLKPGDPAPDFSAIASDGRPVSLAEFRGKQAVVLFFYPRDNTTVCTQQACAFRDAYQDFTDAGAAVYSTDITPTLYALLGYPVETQEWPLGRPFFVPAGTDQSWRTTAPALVATPSAPPRDGLPRGLDGRPDQGMLFDEELGQLKRGELRPAGAGFGC